MITSAQTCKHNNHGSAALSSRQHWLAPWLMGSNGQSSKVQNSVYIYTHYYMNDCIIDYNSDMKYQNFISVNISCMSESLVSQVFAAFLQLLKASIGLSMCRIILQQSRIDRPAARCTVLPWTVLQTTDSTVPCHLPAVDLHEFGFFQLHAAPWNLAARYHVNMEQQLPYCSSRIVSEKQVRRHGGQLQGPRWLWHFPAAASRDCGHLWPMSRN